MPLRLYPLDKPLVDRLRARRHGLRWSQQRLAAEAGITEAVVAKYETMRTPIAPQVRAAVEAALSRGEAG